jgi:AcrR family transcriptional regulator
MATDPNNNKIRKLTSTAHQLFMKHGIRRVTVEEICSEASISKMTFYKYFKNKIDLSKYLLNQVSIKQMADYRLIMDQQIPFTDKVKNLILLKKDQTDLMSEEFIDDLCKNPIPELVELLAKLRTDSLNEILNDLKVARENGEIRKDIKPEFILYILKQFSEMSKDKNLTQLYDSNNKMIMEITNFFFYGILNEREERNCQ